MGLKDKLESVSNPWNLDDDNNEGMGRGGTLGSNMHPPILLKRFYTTSLWFDDPQTHWQEKGVGEKNARRNADGYTALQAEALSSR